MRGTLYTVPFTMLEVRNENVRAIAIILENPLTSLIDFVTLSMMFTCLFLH